MEIRAAVVREKGGIFNIETVELEDPKYGEVLVKVVAAGVCHTDEHARNGVYQALPYPAVLGHEGAGIIEKVGEGVTNFKVGDQVVLSYPSCGKCENCLQGRPTQCENLGALYFSGCMEDGTTRFYQNGKPLYALFNQGSFATHCVINERSLVKIDKNLDLKIMGPLGCGFQTGAGSVLNVLKPEPASSIIIFGAGSVGLAAVMAAKLVNCDPIIAVDVIDARLQTALEVGATHTVNSARTDDLLASLRDIVGGKGVDYVFDNTAAEACIKTGLLLMHRGSVGANVGGGKSVTLDPWTKYMTGGKTWCAVTEGNSVSPVFIPRLVKMFELGRFPIDKLITFFPFDQINEAFEANLTGAAIKPILLMP